MFNVGGPEVLVILLVALIVLGPAQLPKAARQVGQVMNEIRKISTGFQQELTNAMQADEVDSAPRMKPQSPGGPHDVTAPIEAGATDATGSGGDTASSPDDTTDEPS